MPTTPLYPVSGHPLLGDDALALDAPGLREWGLVAERLLGIRGPNVTVFTGDAAEDLTRAVAMQVSLLAATDPAAFLQEDYGIGSESVTYREGYPVHPYAQKLVDQILGEAEEETAGDAGGWPIFRGWRDNTCPPGTSSAEQATAGALARRNRGLG